MKIEERWLIKVAGDNSDHVSEETIQGISIYHWDYPEQDCMGIKDAAKWAWTCLERLAEVFCDMHCNQKICKPGIYNPLLFANDDDWYKVQKDFHQSLSYLSILHKNDNTCPACAITTALAQFPILAEYSPRPPIAVVKMDAIDCYPDIVPYGGNQDYSIPCCIIETEYPDGISHDTWIRELALLHFDFDSMPPLPPWEA